MAIMIIDPNKESREAAAKVVRWVDNRHHLELAADAASAWPAAVEWQPVLILCEPNLPDMRGEKLCHDLRHHLQSSTFIAYTNNAEFQNEGDSFDGFLPKPPSRLGILTHFINARRNSKTQRRNTGSSLGAEATQRRARFPREKPRVGGEWISIVVSAHADELKFTVPIPAETTIELALAQMGKSAVTWFSLLRNGVERKATAATMLEDGDELLIRI